jgi:hypothetical protein
MTLQTIAAGATGVVSYTFAPDPTAIRGYLLGLSFGAALNAAGRAIYVSDVDFRATPGVIIGIQANPPPPELRPVASEMVFCQRYYEYGGTELFTGDVTTGGVYYCQTKFMVIKRANPTVVIAASSNSGFPAGAAALAGGAGIQGFRTQMTANGSQAAGYFQYNWTATAEL